MQIHRFIVKAMAFIVHYGGSKNKSNNEVNTTQNKLHLRSTQLQWINQRVKKESISEELKFS